MVKFGDKDYAFVPDRLKKFREANPRAVIITKPTFQEDGSLIFQATIVKDDAADSSARATGTAFYNAKQLQKDKAFEKLETISVGRALANLGYLNDGQIATTEELQEFEDFKQDKLEELRAEIVNAKKRDEFKAIMDKLTSSQKVDLTPEIKKRIAELAKPKETANAA